MRRTYVVVVIPNSKKPRILIKENGRIEAHVDAPPVKGKANKRLIELLARHFGVKKSKIRILRGERSREKIVAVDT